MYRIRRFIFLIAGLLLSTTAFCAEYVPKAKNVADNVYAIIGPLGQRSEENDGLNANYGFIVTSDGVILVDSGASQIGAEKLGKAIRKITDKPVRWVINTGSQDHRWFGNDYFASRGAEIVALKRTAETQTQYAKQELESLLQFLGKRLADTQLLSAPQPLANAPATIQLGGETLQFIATNAHFPGDAMVYLPKRGIIFTGDLVYVDRLLAVLPWSSVKNAQLAFQALVALKPVKIIPGHGKVTDIAQAQRESGDYYDFLVNKVGAAAKEMEPMADILKRYSDLPAFRYLENYQSLHSANMNRAFTEFESQ